MGSPGGTVALTGNNSYYGPTHFNVGTLQITSDNSLGATPQYNTYWASLGVIGPYLYTGALNFGSGGTPGGTLQAAANNIVLNANRTIELVADTTAGTIDTQGYTMTVAGPIVPGTSRLPTSTPYYGYDYIGGLAVTGGGNLVLPAQTRRAHDAQRRHAPDRQRRQRRGPGQPRHHHEQQRHRGLQSLRRARLQRRDSAAAAACSSAAAAC